MYNFFLRKNTDILVSSTSENSFFHATEFDRVYKSYMWLCIQFFQLWHHYFLATSFAVWGHDNILTSYPQIPFPTSTLKAYELILIFDIQKHPLLCPSLSLTHAFCWVLGEPFQTSTWRKFPLHSGEFWMYCSFLRDRLCALSSASPICQRLNSWTDLTQDLPNMCCCDKTPQQKQLQWGLPLAQSSSYLQRSGGDECLCI